MSVAYLSAYAAELLDNLFNVALDTQERIENITHRVRRLDDVLPQVEHITITMDSSQINSINLVSSSSRRGMMASLPTIFTKKTNSSSIHDQYAMCEAPPALWKLDEEDTKKRAMDLFTHPAFFFQAWLEAEKNRQEKERMERRKKREEVWQRWRKP